jgi:hypothetical protein
MWPHEEALADEPIVVRGSSIEEASRTAQELIGRQVKVVKADRIRRGGIAGFFATDLGVEVTVVPVGNVQNDPPAVSFAEAFERLMADASTGDRHSSAASLDQSTPTTSSTDEPFVSLFDEVSTIPRAERVGVSIESTDDPSVKAYVEPSDDAAVETYIDAAVAPDILRQLSVPPVFVPPAFVPPASVAATEALVEPLTPAPSLPAPVPAALVATMLAPPAPQWHAPATLNADHGRMARDVAEAMISHLGEHGTVSVSVRIALADGSELRADARAGNRS